MERKVNPYGASSTHGVKSAGSVPGTHPYARAKPISASSTRTQALSPSVVVVTETRNSPRERTRCAAVPRNTSSECITFAGDPSIDWSSESARSNFTLLLNV